MRCECVICTERFTSSSVISALPCGHCFHKVCLSRWMVESKTCPQCRQKCRSQSKVIEQLYFSTNADETICESSEAEVPEHLLRKIEEKNNEISNLTSSKLQLTNDLSKVEKSLLDKSEHAKTLSIKNKSLQCELQRAFIDKCGYDNANKEVKRLKKIVTQLSDIGTIIENSSEDISGYLSNKDSSQLATMCGVLKRELTAKRQESKKLRLRMHEMNVNSQKESRIKNLENAELTEEVESLKLNLNSIERENSSLQKKIMKLKDTLNSPQSRSINKRMLMESPMPTSFTPEMKKENLNTSLEMDFGDSKNTIMKTVYTPKVSRSSKRPRQYSPESPHLNIISKKSIVPNKKGHQTTTTTSSSVNSMLQYNVLKNKRINGSLMESCQRSGYNGFGGHGSHVKSMNNKNR